MKLSDGGGLYLLLDQNGGAYWRFDDVRPISKKRVAVIIDSSWVFNSNNLDQL
jgi:hypothetical protein